MTRARSHIDPERAALTRRYAVQLPFIHDDDLNRLPDRDYAHDTITVEPNSPMWLRQIAEQLGDYFCRETRFDPIWSAHSSTATVVLLPSRVLVGDGQHYAGAVCIDPDSRWYDHPVAQWFYVHPFERRWGVIDIHWPQIVQRWPGIAISGPFTPAGRAMALRLGAPLVRDQDRFGSRVITREEGTHDVAAG